MIIDAFHFIRFVLFDCFSFLLPFLFARTPRGIALAAFLGRFFRSVFLLFGLIALSLDRLYHKGSCATG